MSTFQQTRQQVYISLQKLGFNSEEIEKSLIACKAQGLIYNVDWCCYYLAHLKQQNNLITNHENEALESVRQSEQDHNHNTRHVAHKLKKHSNSLLYLSDLNDTVFGELKCNGFILNGHKNEHTERILDQMNRIYDILFDFLYETQLRNSKNIKNIIKNDENNNKKAGFGGRLNKYIMNPIFAQFEIENDNILHKFASILNIESADILSISYGRDEFNLMIRLISMYEHGINECFMSFLDYKVSIVQLPHIGVSASFMNYLRRRYPHWSSSSGGGAGAGAGAGSSSCSLSSDTVNVSYSNQYSLGPPSMDRTDTNINNNNNDFFTEYQKRCEMKQCSALTVDLSQCSFGREFSTKYIVSCLFHFYASHNDDDDDDRCSGAYITQDLAVEMFVSSKLAQHILEIVWNETKPQETTTTGAAAADSANGLNENEFVVATQLISLAQHCLPYNKHYLMSILSTNTRIPLPSMHISGAFIDYFKSNYHDSSIASIASIGGVYGQRRLSRSRSKSKRSTKGKVRKRGKKMIKHSKHISAPTAYMKSSAASTVESSNIINITRRLTQLIPYIPQSHLENFMVYFNKLDRKKRGFVSGTAIGRFFRKSGLNESILAQVWDLSDIDNDGRLSSSEFGVAMHLINCVRQGAPLPNVLPHSLIGDTRISTRTTSATASKKKKKKKTEKKKTKKTKKNNKNTDAEWAVFESHFALADLVQLQVSSFVDYRCDDGKYICAQIIDIDSESPSELLLRDVMDSRNRFWCNYHTEMYRIARHKSITLRPVTRREMFSYRIGDRIDINPYHTDCARGWKLGYIIDFDAGQALVSVANMNMLYWVHLDNPMEASPPHRHSDRSNCNSMKQSRQAHSNYSKTPKAMHVMNQNQKHQDASRRASDLTKHQTQQILQCMNKHQECTKYIMKQAPNNVHNVDASGYRSPFSEFENNPQKKLKLLPQDSNASETSGFVMVNYPNQIQIETQNQTKNKLNRRRRPGPVIQFGGTQTDCEVEYVLKTLKSEEKHDVIHHISHINHSKRHTLPINAVIVNSNTKKQKKKEIMQIKTRKNSDFTHNYHEPYYNNVNIENGHRYHSATYNNNNNNNNNNNENKEEEVQQYSNTAPSTPIKLSVERFKYRSRTKAGKHHKSRGSKSKLSKTKSKKAKHHHRGHNHHHHHHRGDRHHKKKRHKSRHTDIV